MTMKSERIDQVYRHLMKINAISSKKDIAKKMDAAYTNVSRALNGDEKYLTDSFTERLNKSFGGLFNVEWITDGKGDMLRNPEPPNTQLNYVPLLPLSAQGGVLNDFVVSVKGTECETIVSPIKDADFAINVSGDSMAPEYPPGSQILIKRINEKAFIDWGRVYVLDTCNGTVIKKVLPSKDKNRITCISVNSSHYPPFEIDLKDVYGFYRVLMCMSTK